MRATFARSSYNRARSSAFAAWSASAARKLRSPAMKRRAVRLQRTSAANTRPPNAIGTTTIASNAPVIADHSCG